MGATAPCLTVFLCLCVCVLFVSLRLFCRSASISCLSPLCYSEPLLGRSQKSDGKVVFACRGLGYGYGLVLPCLVCFGFCKFGVLFCLEWFCSFAI